MLLTLLAALALNAAPSLADREVQPTLPKPQAAAAADLTGYYACTGKAPSGNPYDGIVLIERAGDTYLVTWSTAGVTTLGVGTRTGELFCVGWRLGEQLGVNVYRVRGKTLDGQYQTIPGNGRRHPERLTWLRALPVVKK